MLPFKMTDKDLKLWQIMINEFYNGNKRPRLKKDTGIYHKNREV